LKTLATEREARLTYLKRELVKHATKGVTLCVTFDALTRANPEKIRKLLREIKELKQLDLRK